MVNFHRSINCGKCGKKKERPEQGWCNSCRNEYSRKNRPKHSQLPNDQRIKANCRAYLHTYINRGVIKKGVCIVCGGNEKIEAHHEDYTKPLVVVWYCRKHHVELHKIQSNNVL